MSRLCLFNSYFSIITHIFSVQAILFVPCTNQISFVRVCVLMQFSTYIGMVYVYIRRASGPRRGEITVIQFLV